MLVEVALLYALNELQDILKRADLLKRWEHGNVYPLPDGTTRVEFSALIGVRSEQHARPAGVDFYDAAIDLELELLEAEGFASIRCCSAQVVIEGLGGDGELHKYALHFDRHDAAQPSVDLHAMYHWQVGGDRLETQQFGTVLHLQGPRFPYHPLDPILLVDFVLSHFHGGKRSELMEEVAFYRYPRILYESQAAFVTPFFQVLHDTLTVTPFVETPYWPALCGSQ